MWIAVFRHSRRRPLTFRLRLYPPMSFFGPASNYKRRGWNRGGTGGGTGVEPGWNQGGTEVESQWNRGGTTVEPRWDHSGTEVEPSWNNEVAT